MAGIQGGREDHLCRDSCDSSSPLSVFVFASLLCGMQDLSSLTRDGIRVPYSGCLKSESVDPQWSLPPLVSLIGVWRSRVQTLLCIQLAVSWGTLPLSLSFLTWTVSSVVPVPLAEEKGDPGTRPGMNLCVAQVGCCSFQGLSILIWNREHHCRASCLLKALGLGLEGVSYHLSQSTSF